jgi:hypothetical protein
MPWIRLSLPAPTTVHQTLPWTPPRSVNSGKMSPLRRHWFGRIRPGWTNSRQTNTRLRRTRLLIRKNSIRHGFRRIRPGWTNSRQASRSYQCKWGKLPSDTDLGETGQVGRIPVKHLLSVLMWKTPSDRWNRSGWTNSRQTRGKLHEHDQDQMGPIDEFSSNTTSSWTWNWCPATLVFGSFLNSLAAKF